MAESGFQSKQKTGEEEEEGQISIFLKHQGTNAGDPSERKKQKKALSKSEEDSRAYSKIERASRNDVVGFRNCRREFIFSFSAFA